MMAGDAVDFEQVRQAAERIAGLAHRTPVATCATLDEMAGGRRLFFKCEHLQKAGAFKFRGATNAVRRLGDDAATLGVATHSSGNHAQAVALAAKMRGIPAHIVMPRTASAVKRRAVAGYGATVITCEPTVPAREAAAAEIVARTGATLIHPYDHVDVIAGQGTAVLELLANIADLDAIIVPVGGGGLAAGTCIAAKALRPEIRIILAEPAAADDAARSFASGVRQPPLPPTSVADGLLTGLGELTWPILREHAACVITVSDERIIAAMRLAWERAKLLIEPSAAVPLAVVLGEEFRRLDGISRVGLILSGGNVDLERLPWAANA